jgi:large subunit ribosomal protein L7/L12
MTDDELKDAFRNMTLPELVEFRQWFEEEFGVTGNVPVHWGGPIGPFEPVTPEVEEQTAFNVVLTDAGPTKIKVIKVVRALTKLGLKEAKELVDSAPSVVLESVARDEADAAGTALAAEGADVKIE